MIVVKDIGVITRMLYNLVKPILSERTRRKMHFIGSNLVTGVPNTFNPADVPVAFGGTNPKTIE